MIALLAIILATSDIGSLKEAPLMPLIQGDPLTLRPTLHEKLYNDDHSEENVEILKKHTFPGLAIISTLMVMGLLPFVLRYAILKSKKAKEEPLTLKELLIKLKDLQESKPSDTKAAMDTLSNLFRAGFEHVTHTKTTALTFDELLALLKNNSEVAGETLTQIQEQFKSINLFQFSGALPQKEQVDKTALQAILTLETLDKKL